MSLKEFQIEKIKGVFAQKGYKFFEGKYNLNIVGIRGYLREAGSFDDLLLNIYQNADGDWVLDSFRITTDAGTYWLKNPMNEKGTALLVPNQYRGCYAIGKHKGQYEALVQVKPVSVYRDDNRDYIMDYDASTIETGMFGINIHRSHPTMSSANNNKCSAGCQVFQDPIDYLNFMAIVHKSSQLYGNKFTYTLLDQSDIEEGYV